MQMQHSVVGGFLVSFGLCGTLPERTTICGFWTDSILHFTGSKNGASNQYLPWLIMVASRAICESYSDRDILGINHTTKARTRGLIGLIFKVTTEDAVKCTYYRRRGSEQQGNRGTRRCIS